MATREEFQNLVAVFGEECSVGNPSAIRAACDALRDAWDAQAAEVERLRVLLSETIAEVKCEPGELAALRAKVETLLAFAGPHSGPPCRISISSGDETGVPLTLENAPRAWVVALADGDVLVADGEGWWQWTRDACHDTTEYLLRVGATVLAWRKP